MNTQLNMFNEVEEQKKKIADMKKRFKRQSTTSASHKQNYLVRLLKKRAGYKLKTRKDIPIINELLSSIGAGEETKIITNKFDSPSILFAIDEKFGCKNIYVSTWAITDRGIDALKQMSDKGIPCFVLLDVTHSYKWVFKSGAFEILKDNVFFKFAENHSKMILVETKCGKKISFSGSMNLSNNPRFENIDISFDEEIFDFYKDFILEEFNM